MGACLCSGKPKGNHAYSQKLIASWMRILLTFFFVLCPLSASQCYDYVFALFWKCDKNTVWSLLQKFWADYEAYQQLLSGSDEVSGGSWQIVNAICDEGDGLILWYKVMITLILLLLVLILLETDTMGTFKVLLCSPSSNLKTKLQAGSCLLS
jgi:hypothetical protein